MPNYFTYSFILQDWSSVTSKGCFFYEDDEIVTHVYNLKLTEDSAVYFTAYPLQEPASCKFMAIPSFIGFNLLCGLQAYEIS